MEATEVVSGIDKAIGDLLQLRSEIVKKEERKLKNKKGIRVMTYGTYDMVHAGHIRFLQRAKDLGDELIVAVSTDEINEFKHKESRVPFADRFTVVESLSMVDMVIPEDSWDQKRSDMHKYDIDIFVIGDDWKGEFDYLTEEGVQVIYLPRTPNISTTQLKNGLSKDDIKARNDELFKTLKERD